MVQHLLEMVVVAIDLQVESMGLISRSEISMNA